MPPQGSRVLGMHCVAKRIDSPMARQWLSAVGVDFAQGFLLDHQSRVEEALGVYQKSLELAVASGNRHLEGALLGNRVKVAGLRGDASLGDDCELNAR